MKSQNVKYCGIAAACSIAVMALFLYYILPALMSAFAWGIAENYEFISDELAEHGKFVKAEKILRAAAKKRPWDFRPHQKLGMLYLAQEGKKKQAIESLEAAAALAWKSTGYPEMLIPLHRERLASLYTALARELDAVRQKKTEAFYFAYADMLSPSHDSKTRATWNQPAKEAPLLKDDFTLNDIKDYECVAGAPQVKDSSGLKNLNAAGIFFQTGFIEYELTRTEAKNKTLYILARGTPAFGIYPIIDLKIDNERVAFIYVDSPEWRFYPVAAPRTSARQRWTLSYFNDGALPILDNAGKRIGLSEDRNLLVGGIFKLIEN
ncbi:MAG TPA: hypothetical protein PKW18_02165 [Candidatus Sumerlaeota bacterium]|nr:hypothetical protein [Candidatus Sumerlaeota bacterium]HON49048.1 hypothetical protein [Candidatus Sumerlaeota bacterium]HOR64344.1 hypothetical protein [Candidatus Sumerlaeota bacterium]HPL73363.1 hypothetical protein [Candidatus Sumerlaeota bacterium]HRU53537.1 hypothetical protein [Candidatus Sumerlaeia bacterium]